MSDACLFCKIANGELGTKLVHQDEQVVAFHDIKPQAPQHILIIPRQHIATINDLNTEQQPLVGHMLGVAQQLAAEYNLSDAGYRLVFNCNAQGGQEVYHIHLHLLGGRQMQWPPG